MQTQIKVKLCTDPDNPRRLMARVRRAILEDDGRLIRKSMLSSQGEWMDMEPQAYYPMDSDLEIE